MLWKNTQIFNACETEIDENGALHIYRFPSSAREAFKSSRSKHAVMVGNLTTGCELRFVGNSADIFLSTTDCDGTVEIYRGDFLCQVERLQVGVVKCISLRENTLDAYNLPKSRFSTKVWRVIFDHDCTAVLHDIQGDIRPPEQDELPSKKLLGYGSSITHSAGAQLFTNSYLYNIGRRLGVDVLCKGMGGSCHIEQEVVDYLVAEEWDVALLELGINMVHVYPVADFEQKVRYFLHKILPCGKPVILISNFTSFYNLPTDPLHQENAEYVATLEKLYAEFKNENLYYIKGQDIVTEWEYLMNDVLHPSPYGHVEMGRKIAQIIREEFKIL